MILVSVIPLWFDAAITPKGIANKVERKMASKARGILSESRSEIKEETGIL